LRSNAVISNLPPLQPQTLQRQDTLVRGVTLLPGEQVVHFFTPRQGLVDDGGPPETGRLLVATNQRILSFSPDPNPTQVVLVPVEEVKGVVVKTAGRTGWSFWLQGLFLVLAGVLIYGVVAYWLDGRFGGPEVPFINVGLGPLVTLVAIAGGVWFIGRHYFTQEDSSVTFQGSSWSFAFPYRGQKPEAEIYQVVNGLFFSRQSRNGHQVFWDE
jgi:hypothetical protein